jgi:serine/threonine protein kinase
MEAESLEPIDARSSPAIDWESFYKNYRKPGYIPGYEVVNKLGGGVFGIVYKARKESIGKDYAIKFLKVDDEAVRDAVVRELDSVRFFAQVDHPNLVSIEDKGEVDGIPFIIMSYAGQETLRTRLNAGQLEPNDALRIFIQAARGVQALHEHSLVHFDLKPANVFLKGDIARVGDYGLSKLVTESRNSLSFGRGTPYYMAPEMLQRRGDARSDIYSLGIILYECLTGDVPFKGDSEWEVLRKHETEPPSFPAHVAQREREVIARALAKNPEDRFETVKEMLWALDAPASLGESLIIPPRGESTGAAAPAGAALAGAASPGTRPAGARAPGAAARTAQPPPPPVIDDDEGSALARGVVASIVHLVFRLFEVTIFLVLVPLQATSAGFGRGILYLLQLPFRILGVAFRLTGYLIVALVILMLVVGALSLVMS